MKNLNFFRKAFLTATVVMMSVSFYSCKDKETSPETDIDAIETTEPMETVPTDTTTIPADTVTTAPAP